MGRGQDWIRRFSEDEELTVEPMAITPLVEIAGDHRVLVEGHYGIRGYSREKIMVNIHKGCLCITGSCLEMIKMTRDQLIIRGKIDGVHIQRRT